MLVKTGLCYLTAMKAKAVVVVDPDIMSGTPCFADTRVPVRSLLDYLEAGDSLDQFLEQFQGSHAIRRLPFWSYPLMQC